MQAVQSVQKAKGIADVARCLNTLLIQREDNLLQCQWLPRNASRHGIMPKTDITMVKRKRTKDRQYNGQKKKDEGQTIQWSKEKGRRTDNTMVKRKRTKDRQYRGQKKKDVLCPFAFDHCIVCPSSFFF
jgi:hypothetical protein